MVLSPSLPPNHSKTTRILPDCAAAAARLARLRTYGTGPRPPKRPNPRPPAPRRIRSRRETPQSLSFLGVVMNVAPGYNGFPFGVPGPCLFLRLLVLRPSFVLRPWCAAPVVDQGPRTMDGQGTKNEGPR